MYTLEDDHETSSCYRKEDFSPTQPEQNGQPKQTDQAEQNEQSEQADQAEQPVPAITPIQSIEPTQHIQSMQLTGTFGEGVEGEVTDIPGLPPSPFEKRFSTQHAAQRVQQVSSSFKRLATPSKTNTGNKQVAFAALTVACIAVFFTALDQTVVVTALPQIISDLQIPITQLDHASWIISAYLLGFVVAMPLMGRVSDIYGRRRIFLLCLTIFGIGSIFCGTAPILAQMVDLSFLDMLHVDTSSPGLILLIAARLFQAIGGGAIVPVTMAIAGDFYGQERRGLALGIVGAVTEAGGVLGPLYGAIIVQHLGWQYIFYLNVPLVIVLIVAAWILIPKGPHLRERIDWVGAFLLGIALTCLSLGLAQQGTSLGPTAPNAPAPQNNPIALALAATFFVAFIFVQLKVRWPVVDMTLFKKLSFNAASLVSLLVGAALIIAMADIPIYVDTVLQGAVLDSGLTLMRLTIMIPLGALLGGWLCGQISCRVVGVLGLLFTAAGFFLMSRWPVHVDWVQITISTVTAGFGFGLVIAPIGTTAINAVKATQAGMSSAIVTALRMVGMTLGLAALTSWALAYFKQLASRYPSLPATATPLQVLQWSKGYANHLILSAHTVYTSVFFTAMILCLIAILPAIFLWGRKPLVEEIEVAPAAATTLEPDRHDASTTAVMDSAEVPVVPLLPDLSQPEESDISPVPSLDDPNKRGKWWHNRKRRRLMIIGSIVLLLLLISGGILAAFLLQSDDITADDPFTNPVFFGSTPNAKTATVTAGPRMIQLALDGSALTSIFVSQLSLQGGALTDLSVIPVANDGVVLSLKLHIDMNGIHRVLPIELDGTIGVDKDQNLQIQVMSLKRDGQDAGPQAAANMQSAINQLINDSVMPALHNQLKGAKLISAHTSNTVVCGKGTEMLVLLIQAPPIQGIAAQPTPIPFCFNGPIDLNKLIPH